MTLPTKLISTALVLFTACTSATPPADSPPAAFSAVPVSNERSTHDTAEDATTDSVWGTNLSERDTTSSVDCLVVPDVDALQMDVADTATSAGNTVAAFLPLVVQTIHYAHDARAVNNAVLQATDALSPPRVGRAADILSLSLALPPMTQTTRLDTAFRNFLENASGVATPTAEQEIERRVTSIIHGTATDESSARSLAKTIQASYDSNLGRSLDRAFALLPGSATPASDRLEPLAPIYYDPLALAREATDRFVRAYRAYSLAAAAANYVDLVASAANGPDGCAVAVRAVAATKIASLAVTTIEGSGLHLGEAVLNGRRAFSNAMARYATIYHGAEPW